MAYVYRQRGPAVAERGVDTVLTCDVLDDAGAQQTATAGTVTVYAGGSTIVDGASATLGPPATYTLLGTTTTDEPLSDQWLAIWSLTIGGRVERFRQPIVLVRHRYHGVATDADLIALHAELASLRPSSLTSYQPYIVRAREKIQRDLLKIARSPHLIFDAWALVDAEVALALHYIWRDFAGSVAANPKYDRLAADYLREYREEMTAFRARYDSDQTGTITSDTQESAAATIVLTAGRVRR